MVVSIMLANVVFILLLWYLNIFSNDCSLNSKKWTSYHKHRIHTVSHLCGCESVRSLFSSDQMTSHNVHTCVASPLCGWVYELSKYYLERKTFHTHHRRMAFPLCVCVCVELGGVSLNMCIHSGSMWMVCSPVCRSECVFKFSFRENDSPQCEHA